MSNVSPNAPPAKPPLNPLAQEAITLIAQSGKRVTKKTDVTNLDFAGLYGTAMQGSVPAKLNTIAIPQRITDYVVNNTDSLVSVSEQHRLFRTELRGAVVEVKDIAGNSIQHDNYQEILMVTGDNRFRYTHDFKDTQIYESSRISALSDNNGFSIFVQSSGIVKAWQVASDGRLVINPFNSSTFSLSFSKPDRYVLLQVGGESFSLAGKKFVSNSGKVLNNENVRLLANGNVFQVGERADRLIFSLLTNQIIMFGDDGRPMLTYDLNNQILQIDNMSFSAAGTKVVLGHLNVHIDPGKQLSVNGAVISNSMATKNESKAMHDIALLSAQKAIGKSTSAASSDERNRAENFSARVLAQIEIAKQYSFAARCIDELQDLIEAQRSVQSARMQVAISTETSKDEQSTK